MLRLLVILFVVVSRHQQTPPLTSKCHQLAVVHRGCVLHCSQHATEPDIGSQIAIFAYSTCIFDVHVRGCVRVGILARLLV